MKMLKNNHARITACLTIVSILTIMLRGLNADDEDLQVIREWNHFVRADGKLVYPADKNINLERGCMQAWVTVAFDPGMEAVDKGNLGKYNRPFWFMDFANGNVIQCYWNIDERGMVCFAKNGKEYPWIFSAPSRWQPGDERVITLSWGDEIAVFIDGVKSGAAAKGVKTLRDGLDGSISLKETNLYFWGPFDLDAVRIMNVPFDPHKADALTPTANSATLLLDTFSQWKSDTETQPEKIASGGGGVLKNGQNQTKGLFGKRVHFNFNQEPK